MNHNKILPNYQWSENEIFHSASTGIQWKLFQFQNLMSFFFLTERWLYWLPGIIAPAFRGHQEETGTVPHRGSWLGWRSMALGLWANIPQRQILWYDHVNSIWLHTRSSHLSWLRTRFGWGHGWSKNHQQRFHSEKCQIWDWHCWKEVFNEGWDLSTKAGFSSHRHQSCKAWPVVIRMLNYKVCSQYASTLWCKKKLVIVLLVYNGHIVWK